MFKNYGPLCATVYEFTKPIGSELNGDISYYLERLEGTKGSILEAGVGTGRLLIPLLEEGLSVDGVDLSLDMLKKCQAACHKRHLYPNLVHADLITLNLNKLYDTIIMPTSSFSLLPTEEAAYRVLNNFFDHLLPNGRLIIDLDLPFYPEIGEVTTSTYRLNETTGITLEQKTVTIDWLKQHIITYLKYEKWVEGSLVATELQDLTLRWYGLGEFKLMLEKAGFENITLSADYDYLTTPTDSNQTLTFEATKPNKAT